MLDDAVEKALQLAIAHLDKDFGKGTVMSLGGSATEMWPSISTGALTFDLALGIGGFPRGRIVEIFGPESSGKTTIALSVIAEAQKAGGRCLFIDTEHALDPAYAEALGVDLPSLFISQPQTGEVALQVLDEMVRTGAITVAVVDSVAALVPKAELEGDMGQAHMGLQSRLMSQAMRKLTGVVQSTNTLVIFTNQIREKLGIMFGNPETTPGGRALKFAASVRVDIRRIGDIKDSTKEGAEIVGVRTKAKIIKNKMAPPYRIAEFDILYGRGINTVGCLLDLAVDKQIIDKRGSWYYYNDTQLAQGRPSAVEFLASDVDLMKEIENLIYEDVLTKPKEKD